MLARTIPIVAVYAALSVFVQAAQGSVCSSGIFPSLTALRLDPEVASYCEAHFPVRTVTVTKRDTHQSSVSTNKCTEKKPTSKASSTSTKPTTSRSTTTTPTTKPNKLSSLLSYASKVVSTACSCIQGQPTVTVKSSTTKKTTSSDSSTTPTSTKTSSSSTTRPTSFVTTPSTSSTTSTTSTTSTSTTSSVAPAHTIDAPRCDGADEENNGGCSDQCTCTADTTGTFYCANIDTFITCDTNEICLQGDFCSANSASCVTGTDPTDLCTSTFSPAGQRRSLWRGSRALGV